MNSRSAVPQLGLLLLMIGASFSFASEEPGTKPAESRPGVVVSQTVVNFSELARLQALHPTKPHRKIRIERTPPKPKSFPPGAIIRMAPEIGLAPRATGSPRPLSPDLANNFLAELDDGTSIPPDTQGTVGPNHLMVTLNSNVVIQNRQGGVLKTLSLTNFWKPLGGINDATDPRVVYDPFNNRWITSVSGNPQTAGAAVLVGVSQTADPRGNWFLYKASVDSTNHHFCDFPILGFNKTWVVIMCNIFDNDPNVNFFAGSIYVFDKFNLYGHGSGAHTVLDTGGDSNVTPASTYDNSLSTEYLLEEYSGNLNGVGSLRLWAINGPVGSPRLTSIAFPSSSLTWDEGSPVNNFGPQLNGFMGVDTGDARIGNVIYRNGTVWTTHPVFLPCCGSPNRSSVQWWQVDTAGNILQRGLLDNPDASFFRSYPSIAVNKDNDALLGYARYSPQQYVGGYYSFRSHTDPLGLMENEATLKAGEATYFKDFGFGLVRWGDYSNTSVDPLDDKTMWSIQEYAAAPGDTWGTWWGEIMPPGPPATIQISASPLITTAGVPLTNFVVTVLDALGHRVTDYSGTVHFTSTDPSAVLPFNYTFALGDDGTHQFSVTLDRAGAQSVTVADAASSSLQATVNFSVVPGPLATFAIQVPVSATAGTQFSFSVTAQDGFQNTLTSYSGTVQFSSSDPNASLPTNYAFNPGSDNGTHSFPLTLRLAGIQSISAADVASFGNIHGTAFVPVAAAAASQLGLSAPQNVTRTKPFQLLVTALDTFKNVATSYKGQIHFTSSDPTASLPADYSFTVGDSGQHYFFVTLSTLGQQTVTATDTVSSSVAGFTQLNVTHLTGTARDLRVRLGQPFNLIVAHFTDDANPGPNTLSAAINWGDGNTGAGTVQSDSSGGYIVVGSHSYIALPEHPANITIQDAPNGFGPVVLTDNVRIWPMAQSH